MNPYARALLRFWWLLVIGLGVGAIAAVVAVYSVNTSWPPKFEKRAHATYSASTNLLVDSPSDPYLRTLEAQVTTRPPVVKPVSTKSASGATTVHETSTPQAPSISYQAPDTKTLVESANLFPLLVTSDSVTQIRNRMFGPMSGTVTADAAFSSRNTFGAYHPSPLPIVEIDGTAGTPKRAIAIVQATAEAFTKWLKEKQTRGHIPPAQRIVVQQLKRPESAVVTAKSSKSLALFLAVLVILGFAALAVLFDRIRPVPARRRTERPAAAHEPADGSSHSGASAAAAPDPSA